MFGRGVENMREVERGVEGVFRVRWRDLGARGVTGVWFRRKDKSIMRIRELEIREVFILSFD